MVNQIEMKGYMVVIWHLSKWE